MPRTATGVSRRHRGGAQNAQPVIETPEIKPWNPTKNPHLNMVFLILIIGCAVPAMLTIFSGLGSLGSALSSGSVQTLDISNANHMREVFFGGKPWLVLCRRDRPGDRDSKTHPNILAAFEGVAAVGNKLPTGSGFQVGYLQCDERLPSNKTIYERFRLPSKRYVSALLVANGDKPDMVPMELFRGLKSKDNKADIPAVVDRIVAHVVKKVAIKKPYAVSTDMQMRAQCLRKRACAMILHKEPLSNATRQDVIAAMHEFRTVRWVTVDHDKYALSFEDSIPKLSDPSDSSARVVFFRQALTSEQAAAAGGDSSEGSKTKQKKKKKKKTKKPKKRIAVMAKTMREPFSIAATRNFLATLLPAVPAEKGGVKMAKMARFPWLTNRAKLAERRRREKERQEEAERNNMQSFEAKRKKQRTVKEAKRKREEAASGMTQQEKEQERRQQMEAESQKAAPQAADADDKEDADYDMPDESSEEPPEEEPEDGTDVIDLDAEASDEMGDM